MEFIAANSVVRNKRARRRTYAAEWEVEQLMALD